MEREMKKYLQLLLVYPRVEKHCPNCRPSETMGPQCIIYIFGSVSLLWLREGIVYT